jgi:hypothetical protein
MSSLIKKVDGHSNRVNIHLEAAVLNNSEQIDINGVKSYGNLSGRILRKLGFAAEVQVNGKRIFVNTKSLFNHNEDPKSQANMKWILNMTKKEFITDLPKLYKYAHDLNILRINSLKDYLNISKFGLVKVILGVTADKK